jgi:hypothetical protein
MLRSSLPADATPRSDENAPTALLSDVIRLPLGVLSLLTAGALKRNDDYVYFRPTLYARHPERRAFSLAQCSTGSAVPGYNFTKTLSNAVSAVGVDFGNLSEKKVWLWHKLFEPVRGGERCFLNLKE